MIDSSIKNTERSTSLPWNSNISKKTIPASFSISFYRIMSYPSTPRTLFFEDSNIICFFERYCRICTDCENDGRKKIKGL